LLEAPEVELLNRHLGQCEACRAEWESIDRLSTLFASARALRPAPGFAARVAQRVQQRAEHRRRWQFVAATAAGWFGAWSLGSMIVTVPLALRWRSLIALLWLDALQPMLGAAISLVSVLARTAYALARQLLSGPTWLLVPGYVLLACLLVAVWTRIVLGRGVVVRSRLWS
jgi:anti-sigma factor RsiW